MYIGNISFGQNWVCFSELCILMNALGNVDFSSCQCIRSTGQSCSTRARAHTNHDICACTRVAAGTNVYLFIEHSPLGELRPWGTVCPLGVVLSTNILEFSLPGEHCPLPGRQTQTQKYSLCQATAGGNNNRFVGSEHKNDYGSGDHFTFCWLIKEKKLKHDNTLFRWVDKDFTHCE